MINSRSPGQHRRNEQIAEGIRARRFTATLATPWPRRGQLGASEIGAERSRRTDCANGPPTSWAAHPVIMGPLASQGQ